MTRSEQGGIARVELRHVPVVGQQFAVQPYPVGRDGEDLSLPAQYAREDTFGVRVRGDSMAGDGVLDGDYVVVDPRGEVRDREMVVVGLGDPGDSEVVVRRLRRHNSTIRLESSNPDVEPIILGPDDTPVIYGTVIAVVRRLARQYAREGTFGVRVRGDSMAGDGVLDGDYVVVDPRGEVRDREMVVVGLGDPGDSEVVVRRLRRHNSTIRLESSNPDVEPIILGPDDTPVIYGTVIAAVRHVRKEPGVLWWAFAPGSAATRGHDLAELNDKQLAALPAVRDIRQRSKDSGPHIVVLLDEIDKAEPDLPNDLLGPLDSTGFEAPGVGWIGAAAHDVFVVITSNGERRLPPAFLRRCAQLELEPADDTFLVAVAEAHFGARDDSMYRDIALDFIRYQDAARKRDRREPSTAEFLDTVRACLRFGESPGSPRWRAIVETVLWKEPTLPEEVVGETN